MMSVRAQETILTDVDFISQTCLQSTTGSRGSSPALSHGDRNSNYGGGKSLGG